jgi:DNA-binding GntR family transcriptional regulator
MLDNQQQIMFRKIKFPSITDEVIDQILFAIRSESYLPGQKLPSEITLADQFGISRNTIREAINSLIEKGFLFRQRGIGTFVTPQTSVMLKTNLAAVVGTSNFITEQKRIPGQIGFTNSYIIPPMSVSEKLQIPESEKVMHISRLRTADGIPVIQSDEYIPGNIPDLDYQFTKYSKLADWSIYDFFDKSNYKIHSIITHVHAISADKELAKKLNIEVNESLLCMEQTHFSNAYNRPILYCRNLHNDKIIDIMLIRSV